MEALRLEAFDEHDLTTKEIVSLSLELLHVSHKLNEVWAEVIQDLVAVYNDMSELQNQLSRGR
jgi:hypothetical protein